MPKDVYPGVFARKFPRWESEMRVKRAKKSWNIGYHERRAKSFVGNFGSNKNNNWF